MYERMLDKQISRAWKRWRIIAAKMANGLFC